MGEVNTPDCSWKKMVIAKTNDQWISSMKTEPTTFSQASTTNFSLGNEANTYIVKIEEEDDGSYNQSYEHEPSNSINYEPDTIIQELDPLLLGNGTRRRRKGSGPKTETPEERAIRLAKMSAYAAQRLATETPEQRALRLKRMSEYAAKRLSEESSEQRAKRLKRMSAYAAQRLSKETPEQRQVRLARMSAYAAKRHAMKKCASAGASQTTSVNPYFIRDKQKPDQS